MNRFRSVYTKSVKTQTLYSCINNLNEQSRPYCTYPCSSANLIFHHGMEEACAIEIRANTVHAMTARYILRSVLPSASFTSHDRFTSRAPKGVTINVYVVFMLRFALRSNFQNSVQVTTEFII